MLSRPCSVEGCTRPFHSRGFCSAHRNRFLRHGDPLAGRATFKGDPLKFYFEVVLPYEGDECIDWPFCRAAGGYAHLFFDGRSRRLPPLLCEAVHGPAPTPKHEVAHSCGRGDHGCVTKRHLSWKTHQGNMLDRIEHGTAPRGEKNGATVLTEADVSAIRASTESQSSLARPFIRSSIAERGLGSSAPLNLYR